MYQPKPRRGESARMRVNRLRVRDDRSFALPVWAWLLSALPAMVAPAAFAQTRVSEESVDAAVRKAVGWLKSHRNEWGHWEESNEANANRFYGGDTALAALALLYAGEDPRETEMAKTLGWLAKQSFVATYTYGVRAHALALVPGTTYSKELDRDVKWLLDAVFPASSPNSGAYGYESPGRSGTGSYDHSNSQYGVLGAWMAAEAGVRVPDDYWRMVEEHWLRDQQPDGGWAYQASGGSTGSMTAAGLATLFVTLDKAHAHDEGSFNGTYSPLCGEHRKAETLLGAINRGLEWFGQNYTPESNPGAGGQWHYYYLYGVERIGRASGRKYFRDRDWFQEAAAMLIENQQPDGSWFGGGERELHDTCFALMVLCHGRAPLLFNKLQHGEDWDNKLRDVAGLTRYAERRFERLLNWQIVNLEHSINDLLEAPILYMSGHQRWTFSDEEVAKLREYCLRGGMMLGVSCCSKDEFSEGYKELASRMFPEFKYQQVPKERELIGAAAFPEGDQVPPLFEVHNGVRTLMLHSPKDICAPWNQDRSKGKYEPYFTLGCNVYLYATDRTTVRSRLATPGIPLRETAPVRTVRVARVKHKGRWDPEPYGWDRLATYLNNEAGTKLEVEAGVTLDDPALRKFAVAHITGSEALDLSQEEVAGLRQFLMTGGTLLADAAAGSREFSDSFEQLMRDMLRQDMAYLQRDSFIFSGAGIPGATSLEAIEYTRTARRTERGQTLPRIKAVEARNRFSVLLVPLDVSGGLLGTYIYDRRGYDGESALRIMRNLLLYGSLSARDKAQLAKR